MKSPELEAQRVDYSTQDPFAILFTVMSSVYFDSSFCLKDVTFHVLSVADIAITFNVYSRNIVCGNVH